MILVKTKGKTQLYFPKNSNSDALVDLYLKGTTSNEEYCFENLKDIGLMGNYYQLEVDLSDVKDGEYEYRLPNEIGLMMIGNLNNNNKQFVSETKIKEYEF